MTLLLKKKKEKKAREHTRTLLHMNTCGIKIFDFKKDCLPIPSSFRMNNISRHIFMHKKVMKAEYAIAVAQTFASRCRDIQGYKKICIIAAQQGSNAKVKMLSCKASCLKCPRKPCSPPQRSSAFSPPLFFFGLLLAGTCGSGEINRGCASYLLQRGHLLTFSPCSRA